LRGASRDHDTSLSRVACWRFAQRRERDRTTSGIALHGAHTTRLDRFSRRAGMPIKPPSGRIAIVM
jgi:hypothetical protein